MTKQEIEQAIENGESVWCVYKDQPNIYEIKAVEIEKVLSKIFLWEKEYYSNIKDVFKTKAEAEHYLNHTNVTRTEQLPFLSWEEFKNKYKDVVFTDPKGVKYYLKKCVFWCPETNNVEYCISIKYGEDYLTKIEYDYTEQDFYKAYDECVRLFKGEE